MNDSQSTLVTKCVVIACGAICTADAFLISKLGSNLSQISSTINGALSAPLIGLFLIGVLVPFANKYGASIGTIIGFGIVVWINLGANINKPNYPKLTFGTGPQCFNSSSSASTTTTSINYLRIGEATNLTGFDKVYSVSYVWYGAIGVFFSLIFGILISLATIRYSEKPDEATIVNIASAIKKCYKKFFKKNEVEKTASNSE